MNGHKTGSKPPYQAASYRRQIASSTGFEMAQQNIIKTTFY
jgi:hypothetical protein